MITRHILIGTCCIVLWGGRVSWAQSATSQQLGNYNKLSLNVQTLSFIKNNEYFGPFVEGHTLAGYQLHPYLNYITSLGITSKFGLFLQRDWASTQFLTRIIPTFTLQYQHGVNRLLIGMLEGVHQHRLLSLLCHGERVLTQHPETGFQIYHAGKRTFIDVWLHWLTLLDKTNHTPEEFMAGLSCEQLLVETDSFTLQVPLQIVLYHLGGQGVAVKDYSLWMGALGGRMNFLLPASSFLKSLGLAAYYVTNYYMKQPPRPFPRGHGFYGQFTCQNNWITLQASYWNAYGFSSENLGHPLYQSIQLINKHVIYQNLHRHLAFLQVGYTYSLTNELKLVLHIDPYYDLNHHLLEHEAGIYISYHPCFELMNHEEIDQK